MTAELPDASPGVATFAARGGSAPEFTTRTSAPPIYLTTAFDIASLEQLDSITGGREKGYLYTRDGNPNHEAFANDVAVLERAEAGVVTASGMERDGRLDSDGKDRRPRHRGARFIWTDRPVA